MAGQGNGNVSRNGSRHAEKVAALARLAFVHCLTATACSEDRAARYMRVSRTTVQRYKTGETPVNPLVVYRSKLLWRPFHLCMGRKFRQMYEVRSLPYVLRARRAR